MAANTTVVGNLVRDPDLKTTGDGKQVCRMRLAYNQNRGRSTGYLDLEVWGPMAEVHAEHLGKGHTIAASGELRFRERKTDDRTYQDYVIVNGDIEYLRKPRSNGDTEPAGPAYSADEEPF